MILMLGILITNVVYCSYFHQPYQDTKELVVILTAWLLCAYYIKNLFSQNKPASAFLQSDFLYLLFIITFPLSMLHAINPGETIHSSIIFLSYGIIFVFSARHVLDTKNRIFMSQSLLFLLVILSFYGIGQMAGFEFHPGIFPRKAVSSLGHENFASHSLIILIPLAFSLALSNSGRTRILYYFIFAAGVVHLFLAGTRAAACHNYCACGDLCGSLAG